MLTSIKTFNMVLSCSHAFPTTRDAPTLRKRAAGGRPAPQPAVRKCGALWPAKFVRNITHHRSLLLQKYPPPLPTLLSNISKS